MTTPEEAVRKYLKGIGAIPKEDPERFTDLEQEREGVFRHMIETFVNDLHRYGFVTRVWGYYKAFHVGVDFYDPDLEVLLAEKGTVYDHAKAEQYASIQTRGSVFFRFINDALTVEGDIPVAMLRPIHPSDEFWRETIKEEKPTDITEVHLHMWDHKPAVHIHIEGRNVDPAKLARFIAKINNISKRFITEGKIGREVI